MMSDFLKIYMHNIMKLPSIFFKWRRDGAGRGDHAADPLRAGRFLHDPARVSQDRELDRRATEAVPCHRRLRPGADVPRQGAAGPGRGGGRPEHQAPAEAVAGEASGSVLRRGRRDQGMGESFPIGDAGVWRRRRDHPAGEPNDLCWQMSVTKQGAITRPDNCAHDEGICILCRRRLLVLHVMDSLYKIFS